MLQTSIAQTDLLFSQYLSDMGSYCQELYYSDAVRKIRVSDELTQAERVHVAQEIQKGLQQHQQLHSVYVINHNGNCFFHITNSSLFLENLESVLPKKLSEQNMSLFPFVWTVNSRYENAAAVSLLSMYMQAASFADPFYTGSVVVNCDLTQLTSVLFPSEKGDENPQFYIVDFQGHLIIDSGRQGYGQDLSLGMDVSRILSAYTARWDTSGSSFIRFTLSRLLYRSRDSCSVPPSKGSGCAFDTAGRCSLRLRFVYVCIIYGWAENVCTAWFTGLNDSAE